jgi:hypothetical protein
MTECNQWFPKYCKPITVFANGIFGRCTSIKGTTFMYRNSSKQAKIFDISYITHFNDLKKGKNKM